jgi:Domain of unknown function (DUF4588)
MFLFQFQQTAAALTQLYRDQAGREGLAWQPFQAAAGSLTLLYRDSLEELRLAADINRYPIYGFPAMF